MTGPAVTPRHHPSEATLAQYVAGTLRPGFDVVVAAHLSTCAHCRMARLPTSAGRSVSTSSRRRSIRRR